MESLTAVFEYLLAWTTFAAAVVLFAVTAGPMSHRTLTERLLFWCVAMGMLGASLFRLFGMSEGHVTVVAYLLMLFARGGVTVVGTWMIIGWVYRDTNTRTPVEWLADQIVGYRR